MHQRGVHADQDHGRQCAGRLPGPPRRRLRRALRPGRRGHGASPPAQASHRGRLPNGGERRLEEAENVELIFGEGRFTAPKVVEVRLKAGGVRTLTAEAIFINTGGRPARPALDGLDSVKALDSTSIMELGALPEHLLVLGGGYVGLEIR